MVLPELKRWKKGAPHKFNRYQDRLGGKRGYSITRDGVTWRINPVEDASDGKTGYLLLTNIEVRSGGKFSSWAIFRDGSAHTLPVSTNSRYGRELYRTPVSACAVARRLHKKYADAVKRRSFGVVK